MFCRTAAAAVISLSCLWCAPGESVERLAILPLENLTSDATLDWASSGSAAVLAYDLTGPKRLNVIRVESIRDARLNNAGEYLEGYFANERGGLVFHITIEDPARRKVSRSLIITAQPGDLSAAMNRLAKDVSPEARSSTACNGSAVRSYGEALEGRGAFDAAAHAGPACVPVYLTWAELLLARGDHDGAARVSAEALALPRLDSIDRAQFEYLAATAKGQSSARLQALQRLASLLPSNLELFSNIGQLQIANRDFQAAVRSFETAANIDPGSAQIWNILGYARADAHDLKGARQALERYQELLPPGEKNGLDSLGEVSFYLGDFSAAERYFTQAGELLKAAEARIMAGDLAGADGILKRLPNWGPLERAEWEFITGRRKQALARLEAAPSNPGIALQLALWKAQTGQGPVPPLANDPIGRAISMLLSGRFAEATPLLEQLYRSSNPQADGNIRTLLAWSYAQTARPDAAGKLLDLYPIPLGTPVRNPLLASLIFPRFVALRGEVLHSQKDQQLATKYAGDLPDRIK